MQNAAICTGTACVRHRYITTTSAAGWGGETIKGRKVLTKTLLAVNLTFLLLMVTFLNVAAKGISQTVSFSGKDVPIDRVFAAVKQQTGYMFFYDEEVLQKANPVTVEAKDISIEDFMEMVVRNQPFSFRIREKAIVVKIKTPERLSPQLLNALPSLNPPITVRGRVVNEKGEPATAVTVMVKGTNKGTTTNELGYFVLNNVEPNATLILSGINMETREINVQNRAELGTIDLATKVNIAEEVVVTASTGFQTISRERSTGSYVTVSRQQLEKPTTNIAQRLVGVVPGLQLRPPDADGNRNFEVRGQTSLLANAAPLVVVDGFPIQGDFNSINPNVVESVTVLKDAAAASIWGARAANGVIVITTKNARKGSPMAVEFNAFTQIESKLDLDYVRPLASSAATVEYEKLAYNNWRLLPDPNSVFEAGWAFSLAGIALTEANSGYITAAERDAMLEALKTLDNKKQISDYLLSNPVSTQFNLSLSGGTERMSNFLSLMYEDNKSNFKGTDNKRYMINFQSNSELTKWLGLDVTAMYLYRKNTNNGVTLGDIQNWSPYEMLVNPDGSLTNVHQYYTPILEREVPMNSFPYPDWGYNPIQEIANRSRTVEQSQARLQLALNFKILRGLTATLRGQYELGNYFNRQFANENTFQVRDSVNQATYWNSTVTPNTFTLNLPKGNFLSQIRGKSQSYNVRGQLNFNRSFGTRHEVNALTGLEFQNRTDQVYKNPTAFGYNEQTLGVGILPNGPGGPFSPIYNWLGEPQTFPYVNSFGYNTQRLYSAFGNAAYTYNGKYTLSGSFRFDASNLITDDPDYRYAPFYSAGLSWQMYKEDFIKSVHWIDRLTARLTYGDLGNYDPTTSFRPLITPSASPNVYINDYTAGFSSFGNPTLRWERTSTWNLGFDYSMFNNKLYGRLDVYRKAGKDLLATISIPSIHGTTSQRLNNAEMLNRGIELELGTFLNISKDFGWRGSVNVAYNHNQITDLFVVNYNAFVMAYGGSYAYVEGENANTAWRWGYAGIKDNQPVRYGPKGDTYVLGAFPQGNGKEFMRNMGTTIAPYTLGFMNSFTYKQFDLSFIVTGKFGHVFQRLGFNYPPTWTGRVLPNSKLSEVMNGDPSKLIPLPINNDEPEYYSWGNISQYMDYLIENASHVRLQEINLTYTIPSRITNKIGFNRFMIYAQGNNLATIYANSSHEDPEYPMGTMKPMPRYTFGFKCAF